MQSIPVRNINETLITATTTSTSLISLIQTAAAVTDIYKYYVVDRYANAVKIIVESGVIRYAIGATPTLTKGVLLNPGSTNTISMVPIEQINIIATSGTASLTIMFYKSEPSEGDVGGEPSSGGIFNTVAPVLTTGQRGDIQMDSSGNLNENLATKIAGEDLTNDVMKTQMQATYTNISASTLIKTGAGQFMGFIVNSAGAGATIKFWDQTSAAVPVLLNTMTFTLAVSQGPTTIALPTAIKFTTGLFCTIAVAAMDVTILWN